MEYPVGRTARVLARAYGTLRSRIESQDIPAVAGTVTCSAGDRFLMEYINLSGDKALDDIGVWVSVNPCWGIQEDIKPLLRRIDGHYWTRDGRKKDTIYRDLSEEARFWAGAARMARLISAGTRTLKRYIIATSTKAGTALDPAGNPAFMMRLTARFASPGTDGQVVYIGEERENRFRRLFDEGRLDLTVTRMEGHHSCLNEPEVVDRIMGILEEEAAGDSINQHDSGSITKNLYILGLPEIAVICIVVAAIFYCLALHEKPFSSSLKIEFFGSTGTETGKGFEINKNSIRLINTGQEGGFCVDPKTRAIFY